MNAFSYAYRISLAAIVAGLGLLIACSDDPVSTPPETRDIAGIVKDADGNVIAGAIVQAMKLPETVHAVDTSDAAGAFFLGNLPADLSEIVVRISHDSYQSIEQNIDELVDNDNNSFDVVLMPIDSCCGVIVVNVTNGDSTSPCPGAEVKLRNSTETFGVAESDTNGVVTFDEVCEGEYEIRIAKEGFQVIETVVNVDSCDTIALTAALVEKEEECCDGVLAIVVREQGSNEVLPNTTVKLWRDGDLIETLTTNENGVAVFDGLCSGAYGVDLIREGYQTTEFLTEVGCDQTTEISKSLEKKEGEEECCDGVLYIIVKDDESNEPIRDVKVRLWREEKVVETVETNGDGVAIIDGLCEGNYFVDLIREGYEAQEFPFEIGCDKTIEISKTLVEKEGSGECCNGRLALVVRDEITEQPVANAVVKLWRDGKVIAENTTNEDGVAVFEELCEGGYGVDLIREGYEPREFEIELDCNQNLETTRGMQPKEANECCDGRLLIAVHDEHTEEPVAGALVKLRRNGDVIAEAETNGDGIAVFEELCQNGYGVVILREGYQAREFEIEIGCNQNVETTRGLLPDEECCNGIVRVVVRDSETEEPLANAKVNLWRGGKFIEDLRTNGDGVVVFDGICRGNHAIEILREGYKRQEFGFEQGCNQEQTLERLMESETESCCTARLQVNVHDEETSTSISGWVTVYDSENNVVVEGSAQPGTGFVTEELCAPAEYRVVVTAENHNAEDFTVIYEACGNQVFSKFLSK